MQVGIEARAVTGGGGVSRYVRELLRALARLDNQPAFTALVGSRTAIVPEEIEAQVVPLRHDFLLSYWLQRQVPQAIAAQSFDVVHFTKAAVARRVRVPCVTTIYDVIPILFPASQKLSRRWVWPRVLHEAATLSGHIITISEASKQDIVRELGVSPEKVTVTPLATDTERFTPVEAPDVLRSVQSKYGIAGPYVLYLGTIEPRKNVPLLVRAFGRIASQVPHTLVIAGKPYKGIVDVMQAVKQAGVADRVRYIRWVDDEDLPALYSGAEAFVWPSIYEGWGFPPQEALACGTPTIVSDGGSLPEVVGEAGVVVPFTASVVSDRLFDESFEQSLAQALGSLLTSSAQRQQLRAAGLAHVQQFSWEQVAQKTLAVYHQVARAQ